MMQLRWTMDGVAGMSLDLGAVLPFWGKAYCSLAGQASPVHANNSEVPIWTDQVPKLDSP